MSLVSEKSWIKEMEDVFRATYNKQQEILIWTGTGGIQNWERISLKMGLTNFADKFLPSEIIRLNEMIDSSDWDNFKLAESIIQKRTNEQRRSSQCPDKG